MKSVNNKDSAIAGPGKLAFTLIELMIVITISIIIIGVSFIPYNFYINKAKLRNTIREISQALYEARSMAINGISDNSNVSVGLYIDTQNAPNKLQFFSYPYSFTGAQIDNDLSSDIRLIKEYTLQDGMNVVNVDGNNNGLFFFKAIIGNGSYYYWNESDEKHDNTNEEIRIDLSYKQAVSGPLTSYLIYYTPTNIVDY